MAVPDHPGADPSDLHSIAVDAQQDLHKLAVGLAHAGANPAAVAQLSKMAQALGDVVKVLGEGPPLDQNAQANAAAATPQPGPQALPPGPPAPPPPGPTAPPEQHSIHAAAHSLHAAMVQSAQRRAQGQ